MKLSARHVVLSSLILAASVACSKPQQPTPELTEPAPAPAPVPPPAPAEVATPAPAPEAPPAPELTLETVFFDFDSYALTGGAQDTLRKVATALKANQAVKVQVEGHTDERGSNEYNLALGERRAKAVMDFLVAEGVPSADLSTISYGEERPAAQGADESAWSKNRRGEFRRM